MNRTDTANRRRAIARQLLEVRGWDALQEEIEERINTATKRLTLETFTDLTEVAKLQTEITTLRKVLFYVNNRFDNNAQ